MNVTFHLNQTEREIENMIIKAVVGDSSKPGLMFTPLYDDRIRVVGEQIIARAKATLGAVPSRGGRELTETIHRIGWAKAPIVQSDRGVSSGARSRVVRGVKIRFGLVTSGHPASVRYEYGSARSGNRKGYPATRFMSGAALAVAGNSPGLKFVAHVKSRAVANA